MTPRFPLPSLGSQFWGWRGIMWDVRKRPVYHTIRQVAVSGRSAATANWSAPLTEYLLKWSVMRDDMDTDANVTPAFPANEARTLMGFFNQQRGNASPFFWMDPTDKRVSGELMAASTPAFGADPTNPTSTVYQAVRTMGSTRMPIGGLNEGEDGEPPPLVEVNGNPVPFTPNSPRDGWVTLDSAPSPGSLLTGTYSYYQRVAFKQDAADFSTFGKNFWELKELELVQVRF